MTVTIIYEVNGPEPFDETVRHFFARNWDSTKTEGFIPTILSQHGKDKDPADRDTPITQNDIRTLQVNGLILIEARGDRFSDQGSGRGKSGKHFETEILITMYSPGRFELQLWKRELNRILSEFRPNTGTRVKKSDNTDDSAIASFNEPQLSFAKDRRIDEESNTLVTTALLNVNWLLNES